MIVLAIVKIGQDSTKSRNQETKNETKTKQNFKNNLQASSTIFLIIQQCMIVMEYCRLGFECEILLIVNCEFLHKKQSKELHKKEYAMNNVTYDHTPFARMLACMRSQTCTCYRYHACSLYLHAYTYSCRSSRMSRLRFFKPTANLPTP